MLGGAEGAFDAGAAGLADARAQAGVGEPDAQHLRLSILPAAWLGSARLIDNVKVLVDS